MMLSLLFDLGRHYPNHFMLTDCLLTKITSTSPTPGIPLIECSSLSISPSASSIRKSATTAFNPKAIGSLADCFITIPFGGFCFNVVTIFSTSDSASAGSIFILATRRAMLWTLKPASDALVLPGKIPAALAAPYNYVTATRTVKFDALIIRHNGPSTRGTNRQNQRFRHRQVLTSHRNLYLAHCNNLLASLSKSVLKIFKPATPRSFLTD